MPTSFCLCLIPLPISSAFCLFPCPAFFPCPAYFRALPIDVLFLWVHFARVDLASFTFIVSCNFYLLNIYIKKKKKKKKKKEQLSFFIHILYVQKHEITPDLSILKKYTRKRKKKT